MADRTAGRLYTGHCAEMAAHAHEEAKWLALSQEERDRITAEYEAEAKADTRDLSAALFGTPTPNPR